MVCSILRKASPNAAETPMNNETCNTQEARPATGTNIPATGPKSPNEPAHYHIPAPPVPGKTAWSLSPWLPE